MMPRKGEEVVDVEVTLVHETDKAWLLRTFATTSRTKEAWIAKSLGELNGPIKGVYTLTIPTWLAEEREFV